MVLASFWSEIAKTFTNMNTIVAILLIAGVVLCIIESIIPDFGLIGILAILCEVAAIVVHAILSASVIQVLCLVVLVLLITSLLFLLIVHSAKHGFLAKTAIVENSSSLPQDFKTKTDNKLQSLIGQEALTITECRPVGKIRIANNTYEAQATSKIIAKGEVVRVVAIEDSRIIIDKIAY